VVADVEAAVVAAVAVLRANLKAAPLVPAVVEATQKHKAQALVEVAAAAETDPCTVPLTGRDSSLKKKKSRTTFPAFTIQ
jgi:hypothetical protein